VWLPKYAWWLNSVERLIGYIRNKISNYTFKDLEELKRIIRKIMYSLKQNSEQVKSICMRSALRDAQKQRQNLCAVA
jgi:uncharacterized protein YwgA